MVSAKMQMLLDLSDKMFDNKLAKMQAKFTKRVGKMKSQFQDFSNEIPGMGRALDILTNKWVLLGAGIMGIGVVLSKSVQSAEAFDSAFIAIRQMNMDKPKSELDSYRNKIREVALDIGSGLVKSTHAVYDLQSATGIYGDDAIKIFKKVGRYSFATSADINDAINATTKSIKAFGLEVEDIDGLLKSNAKTVLTGITTFDQLAKVQTQFGGVAGNIGQSVDTANKLFAVFTGIGGSVEQGATLTKSFFEGLTRQASKIEEHLQIKVFDEKGNFKQANTILREIGKRFENLSQKQVSELITKIGGPDGLSQMLLKMKGNAKSVINTFDSFDSSNFSLAKAVENAKGDFGKMKKVFFNRLNTVSSIIGEKIIPVLAKLFDFLNPAIQWFGNNVDWLLPILGTLITVIIGAKIAMFAFNTALWTSPITWVVAGIVALIGVILLAAKKVDGWGKQWDSVVTFMKYSFLAYIEAIKLYFKTFVNGFLMGLDLIKLGWYKFKNATGIGDTSENNRIIAQIHQDIEARKKAIGDGAKKVLELQKKANESLKWELSWNQDEKEEKEDSQKPTASGKKTLYDANGKPIKNGNPLQDQVTKVVGDTSKTKSITINIDALNKGNLQLNKDTSIGMTKDNLEDYFTQMLLKVVRSAELS